MIYNQRLYYIRKQDSSRVNVSYISDIIGGMRTEEKDSMIIVYLEGKITSSNSDELAQSLEETLSAAGNEGLILDASDLEYISSAGLRVIMRASKKIKTPAVVQNVSPEVYEIFEMTGFTSFLDVQKKLKTISIDGCELIGEGAFGKVYRIDDDTIVKVYEGEDSLPLIQKEKQRARQAFIKGIPTAISYDIVRVGSGYGSVFEMIKARTLGEIMSETDDIDVYIPRYVELIKSIHEVEVPLGELPQSSEEYLTGIDELGNVLPEDLASGLRTLLSAMPDDAHIVHGDIQIKNVMTADDEFIVIDMETVSCGAPVFDLAGLFMTYMAFNEDEPGNCLRFLGLDDAKCTRLWNGVLNCYYEGLSEEELRKQEEKIMLLGYLRFLDRVATHNMTHPDLKEIRIRHSIEHIRELLSRVDQLS